MANLLPPGDNPIAVNKYINIKKTRSGRPVTDLKKLVQRWWKCIEVRGGFVEK